MNWLWAILGAGVGALLLRQSAGLLIGAVIGVLVYRAQLAQQATRSIEIRLRAMEGKLAELESGGQPATPGISPAALQFAAQVAEIDPAASPAASPEKPETPVVERSSQTPPPRTTPAPESFNDPDWTSTSGNAWVERLFSGNLLAKAGVVLLFFGVASGLKMAIDHGLFPPLVRLFLAAGMGAALVWFGHNRARKSDQQAFGFSLQGGGFALLYLSLYFAFSRYGYVSATPAFIGFALLGVGCALLALRQDSQVLAWLGLSGAFFAPALASTGGNQYVILFSHFLLLDGFIVAISSRKSWRSLNLLGFFLTSLFGFVWALERYSAAFRINIEIFLLLFFLLYTLAPALLAYYRKPTGRAWLDGTLLFGVPAVAAAVQAALGYERDYLALTALLAGLYYLALAGLTRRADNPVLPRAFIALALTCLTVAIPLYFGASVTTVFWALEGAAVLAFGLHQKRPLAVAAGLAIQVLAALRLLDASFFLHSQVPFWNAFFPGALALSLAGAISAWRLHKHDADKPEQALILAWALGWWLLAGWNEAATQLAYPHRDALVLLWMVAASLALEWIGALGKWTAGRYAAGVLWPATLLALLSVTHHQGHPLAGDMLGVLPLALWASYWGLHRQQTDGLNAGLALRHLGGFWMLMLAAVIEAGWQAEQLAPTLPQWAPVAIIAVLCLGLSALRWLQQQQRWPVAGLEDLYALAAPAPVAAGLAIGLLLINFNFSGAWNFAYWPLLNPLDLMSLLGLLMLWKLFGDPHWQARLGHATWAILGTLGLLWLTALWARIAHHFLGVPFSASALEHSAMFQAGVSLLWTTCAITTMILSSRRHLRQLWFVGIALLGIVGVKLLFVDLGQSSMAIRTATLLGMGGLILIAGYFAPAPPKPE